MTELVEDAKSFHDRADDLQETVKKNDKHFISVKSDQLSLAGINKMQRLNMYINQKKAFKENDFNDE